MDIASLWLRPSSKGHPSDFNKFKTSVVSSLLVKTASKSVHSFGWNFVYKQSHRLTHTDKQQWKYNPSTISYRCKKRENKFPMRQWLHVFTSRLNVWCTLLIEPLVLMLRVWSSLQSLNISCYFFFCADIEYKRSCAGSKKELCVPGLQCDKKDLVCRKYSFKFHLWYQRAMQRLLFTLWLFQFYSLPHQLYHLKS